MALTRSKAKGRREGGAFVPLPTSVLNHPNIIRLTPYANKLLTDLLSQLRFGKGGPINNGDLCPTWSLMKDRDWKSEETLNNAKKELLHYGIISLTRQGEKLRKDKPNLYCITWWAINDCRGKLDVPESNAPPGDWLTNKPRFIKPKRKPKISSTTRDEADRYVRRSDNPIKGTNVTPLPPLSLREA